MLALAPHATSKINVLDDLEHIDSLGFRGEALPSIGAISKFKITSKKKYTDTAYSLSINGGIQEKTEQAALDEGTVIEVRDLFFLRVYIQPFCVFLIVGKKKSHRVKKSTSVLAMCSRRDKTRQ